MRKDHYIHQLTIEKLVYMHTSFDIIVMKVELLHYLNNTDPKAPILTVVFYKMTSLKGCIWSITQPKIWDLTWQTEETWATFTTLWWSLWACVTLTERYLWTLLIAYLDPLVGERAMSCLLAAGFAMMVSDFCVGFWTWWGDSREKSSWLRSELVDSIAGAGSTLCLFLYTSVSSFCTGLPGLIVQSRHCFSGLLWAVADSGSRSSGSRDLLRISVIDNLFSSVPFGVNGVALDPLCPLLFSEPPASVPDWDVFAATDPRDRARKEGEN